MRLSRGEVARTLIGGRLPGRVRAVGSFDALNVEQSADGYGRPLLLTAVGGPADRDLDRLARSGRVVVVSVDDRPPLPGSPSLGQVRVAGRPVRLDDVAGRAAALEFAQGNPAADLLDVGAGAVLYRVEVGHARVRYEHKWHDLDPAEYSVARPDPLHEDERHLLADLHGHHAAQIGAYLVARLAAAGTTVTRPVPVRLDRYGFTVATGVGGWHRVDFPAPVSDRHELAAVLHGVLFHGDTDH